MNSSKQFARKTAEAMFVFRFALINILMTLEPAGAVAQPLTNLYSFSSTHVSIGTLTMTNFDGSNPQAGMAVSGGVLYGTTTVGGVYGYGTIFKVGTNGGNFSIMRSFTATDGIGSVCTPVISNGVVYGATTSGSSQAGGVIFKINTNGTGYTALHTFSNNVDGSAIMALTLMGSNIYGVASKGGTNTAGTVFKLGLDGSAFSVLRPFGGVNDGVNPVCICVQSNFLVGSTSEGGTNSWGAVFRINTNGSGYRILMSFDRATTGDTPLGLLDVGGVLYGSYSTGSNQYGGIFRINADGSGFSVVKSFTSIRDPLGVTGTLAVQGSTLYGASAGGGALGYWVEQAAELLKPVYRAIREDLLAGNYLQADETPIRYLDPDVKGKSQQGYLWVYSRPKSDVLFEWRVSRARAGPEEFLKNFRGKLQTDGYGAYESLAKSRSGDLTLVGCWAHVRRGFHEALAETKLAAWFVGQIGQLYAVEKQLRKQKAGPALRQTMRVWQSQPVMTRLHRAMELVRRKTLPQGLLGQAIDYTLKRWTALNQFITDGILEIDNNLIENSIRPSALGKRNWMFIGHPEAGERSAVIYTLLGSCRRLGINPFDYLKDLFTRLPAAKITQIKQFTPAMWVRARTGASLPAEQNLP